MCQGVARSSSLDTRGEAKVRNIAGKVTGTIGAANSRRRLRRVQAHRRTAPTSSLARRRRNVDQHARSGELHGSELAGADRHRRNGTEVTLERLEKATGIPCECRAGSVNIKGTRTDARIDVRNADVDVVADRARRSRSTAKAAVQSSSPGARRISARRLEAAANLAARAAAGRRPGARSTAPRAPSRAADRQSRSASTGRETASANADPHRSPPPRSTRVRVDPLGI